MADVVTHEVTSLREALFRLGTGDSGASRPGTGDSGPQGVEAIIEYNGLYMNVRSWIDTFLITNISGLDDADVRDTRDTNPGAHGETPGFAFYGGRTVVLQGKIVTRTLWKLRDMQVALRQAFSDLTQELPLIFHGQSVDQDLQVYCRKSQKLEMAEQQTTLNYFERQFSITLRASNPFFTTIFERYAQYLSVGGTYDDIALSTVNKGNFPSTPRMEFVGPITSLQLINENNNEIFKLRAGTVIPNGEIWAFEGQRLYRKSDGASRWSYVDPSSTDFTYNPGEINQIHLTATAMSGSSQVLSWNRDAFL